MSIMGETKAPVVIGPPLRRKLAALGLDVEAQYLDGVSAATGPSMMRPRHGDGWYLIIRQAGTRQLLAIAGTPEEVAAAVEGISGGIIMNTITVRAELPEGVSVSTRAYRASHGEPPLNCEGYWIFADASAPDDMDLWRGQTSVTLLAAIDELPEGDWVLQP